MFHSQLYRSIRQVCRGFPSYSYYAITISLPLFISLPTAYGAVVVPNNDAHVSNETNNSRSENSSQSDSLTSHHEPNETLHNSISGTSVGTSALGTSALDTSVSDSAVLESQKSKGVSTSPLVPPLADSNKNNAAEKAVLSDPEQRKPTQNNNIATGLDTTTSTIKADNKANNHAAAELKTQPEPNTGTDALPNAAPNSSPADEQTISIKQQLRAARQLTEDLDKDSVQHSLERLAEFYQISTDDLIDTELPSSSIEQPLGTSPLIDTNANAPLLATDLFNSQGISSQRCEGVWVTSNPIDSNSDYSQAIKEAQQDDGLDLSNGLPLYAQADYAYYDNISYLELAGNVELVQNGQLINAEQIVLDLETGIASVQGNVLLSDSMQQNPASTNTASDPSSISDSGVIIAAKALAYDTNSAATTAHEVAFAGVEMQAHGYAEKLNRPDATHLELEKVMFSTCPPTDRKWQLEAQNIDIDSETGRGKSYNTTFRLGNVPVLYLPYFEFPIDDRRSSGLLTPSASLDSENGLQVSVPYYLNLAPNYDATITTDIYTNKNPMLTAELRYLTQSYGEGNVTATYLPSDKQYNDKNRRALFYAHSWRPEALPNLSAEVVYNYVSDSQYLDDFDDFGTTDSRLNLPRRAQVNYYNDYLNAELKVETFQSLDAVDAEGNRVEDKDKPYSRLPQLSATYNLPRKYNVLLSGVHDSAYFKKSITDGSENEKSGVRVYNKIGASYPIERSWGHITPQLNLHHLYTAYDEESRIVNNLSTTDNTKTAFVPEFSLDSALNFYQAGSPFGVFDYSLGGYQLLTPRLKYTYAAYKDQSDIPNFNTRTASFDYDQLFADSRFLGYDRIPDNNNVTLGVDYRYIDAMGVTRFDGSIGDQFYLDDIEVTLNPKDKRYNVDSSGIAWRSSLQPYRNLWLDFSGAMNSSYDLNFVASQIRYQPTPLSLINVGVVERKEDKLTNQSPLSAFTASTIIPFSDNWRFMAQSQYDNRNNKFIDSTVGVGFEDCCYGFSIYGRSYYNDLNFDDKPTQAVMFEFRINGLGDKSSRFSRLLNDKILGFEPIDKLWQK